MKVLFVCLGNICRSPTAEAVFRSLVEEQGLTSVEIDSAGTSNFHIGEEPDKRAQLAAEERGYDLSPIRGRQVSEEDFYKYDYILAMDKSNLANLQELDPKNGKAKLQLLLDYSTKNLRDRNVPDPYWSERDGFDLVLDLIEDSCANFLKRMRN